MLSMTDYELELEVGRALASKPLTAKTQRKKHKHAATAAAGRKHSAIAAKHHTESRYSDSEPELISLAPPPPQKRPRKPKGAKHSAGNRRTCPASDVHDRDRPDPLDDTGFTYVDTSALPGSSGTPNSVATPGPQPLMLQSPHQIRTPTPMLRTPLNPIEEARRQASNAAAQASLGSLGQKLLFMPAKPGYQLPVLPIEAKVALSEAMVLRRSIANLNPPSLATLVEPLRVNALQVPDEAQRYRQIRDAVRHLTDDQLLLVTGIYQDAGVLDKDLYTYVRDQWRRDEDRSRSIGDWKAAEKAKQAIRKLEDDHAARSNLAVKMELPVDWE